MTISLTIIFAICLFIADMIPSNKPQLQIGANQLNLKHDHDMGWIIPKLRRYKWHADQIVQTFNKHLILFSVYVTSIRHYMGFMRPINMLHHQIFSNSRVNFYQSHFCCTGWSIATVTNDISLRNLKNAKNGLTQWFLESFYAAVLVFWCLKMTR